LSSFFSLSTKRKCLRVSEIRKEGYDNLEEWMKNENNVYVGRSGRIFIKENGINRIFHYKGSKFGNPFKVKDNPSLKTLLEKYKTYLIENELDVLAKKELKEKNIGCYCPLNQLCHCDVLISIIEE